MPSHAGHSRIGATFGRSLLGDENERGRAMRISALARHVFRPWCNPRTTDRAEEVSPFAFGSSLICLMVRAGGETDGLEAVLRVCTVCLGGLGHGGRSC